MNGADVATWMTSPLVLLAIIPVAAITGRLLTRGVARLVEPHGADARTHRIVEGATVLAAMGLWWWEVMSHGQLPSGVATVSPAESIGRYAAHLSLFFFLASAAWVDLRHRVIPDQITVPGVLAGLAWNAMFPFTLLPVPTLVERSFATPEVKPDVLGFAGGLLGARLPVWMDGPAGLTFALAMFIAWWSVGTAPDERPASSTRVKWLPSSRVVVALLGTGCLLAAWSMGGHHWSGLVTALVGLAVSGGIVWATRIGASWALGREAMGFGDVTLMAMAGAWLGWQACLLACLLGVFIGLVHGLSQLAMRSESELPFGPSLCLGLATVVIAWRPLWEFAGPQFERPLELAVVAMLVISLTALTLWGWSRWRGRPQDDEDRVAPP